MGLFDDGVSRAHERQKEGVLEEARKAGAEVLDVLHLAQGADATRAALGSAMAAFFGGSMKVDAVQVFRMQSQGWLHFYVQPYAGVAALPGEHHGMLHGSLGGPAILRAGGLFGGARWDDAPGPAVAQHLAANGPLGTIAKKTAFEWATGLSTIHLTWAVQLRSVGDGTTHVAMQTGRYGGFTTYGVGMAHFLQLCGALPASLQRQAYPAQSFVEPPRWSNLLEMLVTGQPPAPAPAPATPHPAVDYAGWIRNALAGHLGKRVWFGTIPHEQLGNIQRHVLPAPLRTSPLIAGLDLTTFGSAKDAIVVTPTHLVAKEFDDVLTLELSSIRAVIGPKGLTSGKVAIEVDQRGTMHIPVGTDLDPVMALLTAIAQANASLH